MGDEALRTVKEAEAELEEKESASDLILSLHLNLALTHLRRGSIYCSAAENLAMAAFTKEWKHSLLTAIEHGNCALAIDANNEKGLLRRGCGRSRLSEMAGYEEN